jgi:prepilin-type N-terminal cleavage/methylation domain-containing protein
MIYYLKNLISRKLNAGMTYVELIVVLSIFAVMSSIVIFNYGEFQTRIDIKNLASDIALKIVEAQKSSLSGNQNPNAPTNWKPSYGVYFFDPTSANDADGIAHNKKFDYFADLDQNGIISNPSCSVTTNECLDKILITKDNSISKLEVVGAGCSAITDLGLVFKRPNSRIAMTSNNLPITCSSLSYYAQITIKSPKTTKATIKIYPSGRIQVN